MAGALLRPDDALLLRARAVRAEESRAEESRAEESRAEESRAKSDETVQGSGGVEEEGDAPKGPCERPPQEDGSKKEVGGGGPALAWAFRSFCAIVVQFGPLTREP